MICPKCKAEYRDGFTVCADCLVPLIWQLPSPPKRPETTGNAEAASSPFDPRLHEDPFCAFWQGEDTRIHAELCAVLQEAGIPCKTVRREDHLFRLSATSALKIGVPFSLYEEAEAAVREAFGSNEDGANPVPLLPPSSGNAGEAQDDSDHVSSAASDFDPQNFFAEDATAQVWSGDDSHFADFLLSCLHTNEIQCRRDREGKRHLLLFLPGCAERAREIVRQVVKAAPPAE